MPKKPLDKPEPVNTYGYPWKEGSNQLLYDRLAFARRTPVEQGAPLRLKLFQKISDKILPNHFEWHEWTIRMVDGLCNNGYVGLAGCAGSAKTFNVASFAVAWWLCDPGVSSVTFVSTSKQMLRKRGWAEVKRCYSSVPGPRFGNFVDSRMLWQATRGDDKHAIIGKAVEEGALHKVADDIKGVHTRRQMVVIDEATAVPEAIWEAVSNLFSYPEEFILVAMGNPLNRLDQFGRFCEPKDGFISVTVDSDEWEGKPQDKYGGAVPFIMRFDAEKSPNITQGQIVSKHLPTKEKVDAALKASGGQTPQYWQNFRGFWPPEGLTKTIFTESVLQKTGAYGKHKFTGRFFSIIGAFDPAFGGGDRPTLRFAKLGEIQGGTMGIEWCQPRVLPINAHSTNPVHFQLAEQLRRQCERFVHDGVEYSCDPENVGIDATGEGGGLCDIVQRTWSPKIIRIEFGGRASEDCVSLEDARLACDVYENKSVEMHFRTRDAMNAGQLKGVDKETAEELCNRMFDDSGKRIKLQKKRDYKELFKKSPDFGDCGVMVLEVARRKGFRVAPVGQTISLIEQQGDIVKDSQAVFEQVNYEEEQMEEFA